MITVEYVYHGKSTLADGVSLINLSCQIINFKLSLGIILICLLRNCTLSKPRIYILQLNPEEVTVLIEDDGTAVTDDKFFKKLPAQTVFVFLKKGETWRGGTYLLC